MIETLYWKNQRLYILNQLLLPHAVKYVVCNNHADVADAIRDMVIRGAPAIGIAAGYGMYLASIEKPFMTPAQLLDHLQKTKIILGNTRPTAVNLFWALDRMMKSAVEAAAGTEPVRRIQDKLCSEAHLILKEDIAVNKKIGRYGASLLPKNSTVITHCNAGSLATGGFGTALGVITEAYRQGKIRMVYVDETRPYMQGARLTLFELKSNKIPATLICDNMAGHVMKTKKVNAVIVGADRVASGNGDVANKIGTYGLAILAAYHKVRFYVAAPKSTFDAKLMSGNDIRIEERSSKEVTHMFGKQITPDNTEVFHPAFDVTPNKLITGIITENGILTKKDFIKRKS
jgi:methylthioribose-1-phosphate isomerase